MDNRTYITIDLKSFYGSVECVERALDSMTTNLVVVDVSRTEKTICLAVSPGLKAYGISGRARFFAVIQKVREVNARQERRDPGGKFTGSSTHDPEVRAHSELALDYLIAPPQMARYMEWAAPQGEAAEQLDLFTDYEAAVAKKAEDEVKLERESGGRRLCWRSSRNSGKMPFSKGRIERKAPRPRTQMSHPEQKRLLLFVRYLV